MINIAKGFPPHKNGLATGGRREWSWAALPSHMFDEGRFHHGFDWRPRLAPDKSQKVISGKSRVANERPHDAPSKLSMSGNREPTSPRTDQNDVTALRVVPKESCLFH